MSGSDNRPKGKQQRPYVRGLTHVEHPAQRPSDLKTLLTKAERALLLSQAKLDSSVLQRPLPLLTKTVEQLLQQTKLFESNDLVASTLRLVHPRYTSWARLNYWKHRK